MAQYRDLAAFAQFGADQLDKATQAQLGRGQRLTEILKQDQYAPFTVEKQVLSLFVATSGALDSIPVPAVRRFEREFIAFVETNNSGILKSIAEKKALDDTIRAEIKKAVESFKERFNADVEAHAGDVVAKPAAPAKKDAASTEDPSAKKEETPVAK
jgi:F-type H+-transporting ATPase subunit alpha